MPITSSFRTSFAIGNANSNADDAIKEALETSKKYGITSKEARVAWDIVEEINASNNSAAYTGGVSKEVYENKISELSDLLEDYKPKIDSIKNLAMEVRNIKLAQPRASAPSIDSESTIQALAEAKDAVKLHGPTSVEAKLAWETVEEIASNNMSEVTKGNIEDECLVEALEACEAIEEIRRVVFLEKKQHEGRYHG